MMLGVQSRGTAAGAVASCLVAAGLTACSGAQPQQQAPSLSYQSVATAHAPPVPAVPVRLAASATSPTAAPSPAAAAAPGAVPRVKGVYKVGKPYDIGGVTYVPTEDPGYDKVGLGSWYGPDFHGKQTANGELFDMGALTAAHPTMPLPSYAWVTNLRNGRTILVRVNDRGPYKPGRIMDLSRASARVLDFERHGVTEIRVRYAGRAPLDPADDRKERQHIIAQPWSRGLVPLHATGPGAEKLAAVSTAAQVPR